MKEWTLTYYAVTAQVLPTLLIAFVIGMRNLRFPRSWFTIWLGCQGVLVLGGTSAAIWALRHGAGTSFVDSVIYASYAFLIPSFAAMILRWFAHPDDVHSGRAFLQPPTSSEQMQSRPARSKAIFLFLALAALLGAAKGLRRS